MMAHARNPSTIGSFGKRLQVQANPGQLSGLVKPYLKMKIKKGLGIKLSIMALDSLLSTK